MSNNRMLYKCPGPYSIHGAQFDYCIIDEDEDGALEHAINAGWFYTPDEAKKADEILNKKEIPEDNAPPTRDEMVEKAQNLGIKNIGRMTDETLNNRIEEALKTESESESE